MNVWIEMTMRNVDTVVRIVLLLARERIALERSIELLICKMRPLDGSFWWLGGILIH
jgi:hypothetical protein